MLDRPFISVGNYTINTVNITHIEKIQGGVLVYFNGGNVEKLSIGEPDAQSLMDALYPLTRNATPSDGPGVHVL